MEQSMLDNIINIVDREISEILDEKEMEFSAYAILHRALPNGYDGFKPSYRRILYTMRKMTNLTKSANVTGEVMKIHSHGDSYPTVVNMVQKDTNIIPLVDGKGSFAQHTSRDLQPASSRYSEVKISDYALDMMKSLNKNIVDMIPTFDGEKLEPLELPVRHPQVLTLAQQGMAVGMASNIPSFNLVELCGAIVEYLETGKKTMLIPDFATKGYIVKEDKVIKSINELGRGVIKLRGRYEVIGKSKNIISIKEIPYTTTREAIIEKVEELVKNGKLKEIVDIKDTTDIKGMEIEITLRKGSDIDLFIHKLCKLTPFESSLSVNMNMLFDNIPMVVGVWEVVDRWLIWRRNCIKRVLEFDTKKLQDKLHILKGFEKIMSDTDKAVEIVRFSKENLINQELMSFFNLDEQQAEEVGSMNLREINKDKLLKRIEEIGEVERQISRFNSICESTEELNKCVIDGLKDVVGKFGVPRMTDIIEEEEAVELPSKEDLIEDYNCYITLTREGYLKKTKLASDSHKVKEGDSVLQQFSSTNKSNLLLFSNKANVYTIKAHQLDLVAPSVLGTYIPTILPLEENEEFIYIVPTVDYKGNIIFGYENGKVAKVTLSSYKSSRTKQVNGYNASSPLIYVSLEQDNMLMFAKSSIDKLLVFDPSTINEKSSKTTQGVSVLKSKEDSIMVSLGYLFSETPKEVVDYYLAKTNAVGKYIRKQDKDLF